MRNIDRAPHQSDAYIDLHFDPADVTLGDGHRTAIPDNIRAAVAAAADRAKLTCPECGGLFYNEAHLKGHRVRRHS